MKIILLLKSAIKIQVAQATNIGTSQTVRNAAAAVIGVASGIILGAMLGAVYGFFSGLFRWKTGFIGGALMGVVCGAAKGAKKTFDFTYRHVAGITNCRAQLFYQTVNDQLGAAPAKRDGSNCSHSRS